MLRFTPEVNIDRIRLESENLGVAPDTARDF